MSSNDKSRTDVTTKAGETVSINNTSIVSGTSGPRGRRGPGLEYDWDGTKLGVRAEGSDDSYDYEDLQGPEGPEGPEGPKGDEGPEGPEGAGVEIAGTVDSYSKLPDDLESEDAGSGYFNEEDGQLYIWDGSDFPNEDNGVEFQGPKGDKGDTGDTGEKGDTGDSIEYDWDGTELGIRQEGDSDYEYVDLEGPEGPEGPQGEEGPEGPEGPQGERGKRGRKGDKGKDGKDGSDGEDGEDGAGISLAGSVDSHSDLPDDLGEDDAGLAYLNDDDGRLYIWDGSSFPDDGDGVEFRGPRGKKGSNGEDGQSLEFDWDGTELGIKRSSDSNFTYEDLEGPKGDTGDEGPEGPEGEKGDAGADGEDGHSIEYEWDGTSLGIRRDDEEDYDFVDLKGEKGDTGEQGPQGERGPSGDGADFDIGDLDLADVATSGSYDDLSDKPDIPNIRADEKVEIGNGSSAGGNNTVAIGRDAETDGKQGAAIGYGAKTGDNFALAFGYDTNAGGKRAAAIGGGAEATGDASYAIGYFAEAKGDESVAIGHGAEANNDYSTAIGGEDSDGNSVATTEDNQVRLGTENQTVSVPGTLEVGGDELSDVAFSGSYEDLTDKPDLEAGEKGEKGDKGDKGDTGDTGPAGEDGADGVSADDLADVATSGDYEDLENKPDIPSPIKGLGFGGETWSSETIDPNEKWQNDNDYPVMTSIYMEVDGFGSDIQATFKVRQGDSGSWVQIASIITDETGERTAVYPAIIPPGAEVKIEANKPENIDKVNIAVLQ